MDPKNLNAGWTALVSLVVGFGVMVFFMNTGLFVGPVAIRLDGADLSFYVGLAFAFCVYRALRRFEDPNAKLGRDDLRNRSERRREEASSG